MIGTTISHYKILEKLGSGGMGVVYKAQDLKLDRLVALKFLPPQISFDEEAKQRFIREAKSASALQHNNICAIHEINETDDSQLYICMDLYDGETLKNKLERDSIKIDESIDIGFQIAMGLEKAHERGIIHRDIKPANIFITDEGIVKILDFGLAKASDQTELTQLGSTMGTLAYMSPEQTRGGEIDHHTDIWSLGVLMYEMITGERPFDGDNEQEIIFSIVNESPKLIRKIIPDIPINMESIINCALEKKQDLRYSSISEVIKNLRVLQKSISLSVIVRKETKNITTKLIRRPIIAIPSIILISLFFLFILWLSDHNANIRWATDEALPKIIDHIKEGDIVSAYFLAEKAEKYLDENPMLTELWPRISDIHSISTKPAGADIFYKEYSSIKSGYEYLGKSPVQNIRFPSGVFRWQIKKEGYQSIEIVTGIGEAAGRDRDYAMNLTLDEKGSLPPEMVKIPGQTISLRLIGFDNAKELFVPTYLIDKFEVTNQQFKIFVDTGAYRDPEYWIQEFKKDGSTISWASAMNEFRDKSGRFGPSTWESGTYPEGEENHPVSGVSWYEAMAYAEFADRDLPTIYHWVNAANVVDNSVIVPFSNFDNSGTASVGSYPGIGKYGIYDMAGNVKEWIWNSNNKSGKMRYILGGSWADPSYKFLGDDVRSMWNRLSDNGFRTIKYIDEEESLNDTLFHPLKHLYPEFDQTPVSEEEFQFYKDYLYNYDKTPLNASVDSVDNSSPFWRREWITFDAPYVNDRIIAHLFIPKGFDPPYQTVVYWPGVRAQKVNSSEKITQAKGWRNFQWEFLVMGGRALLYPVYAGTYERQHLDAQYSLRDIEILWNKDFRRSVDYLCTRTDIDTSKIAFYGTSWGANMGPQAIALENRIKLGILSLGGLGCWEGAPPEVHPVNFAPRVKVPILMINGNHDSENPAQISENPIFELLGTPDIHKKHKIHPGGHGMYGLFIQDVKTDITSWLDRYFGPVE